MPLHISPHSLVYNFPIRLYDSEAKQFVTRDVVCNAVLDDLKEQFGGNLSRFSYASSEKILEHVGPLARYAILSHRWAADEVLFHDMLEPDRAKDKLGFAKLEKFCEAAQKYDCRFVWIDTACIDKTSSSELDESIRSMYTWYRHAYVSIVHFTSDWSSRGWTLQELLAPRRLKFLGDDWSDPTGDRFDIVRPDEEVPYKPDWELAEGLSSIVQSIHALTYIDLHHLLYYTPSPSNLRNVFHWVSLRRTTRPEDLAYCLIGLLGVQIPIAYGEGRDRAFYRLLLECLQYSDDRTCFHWDDDKPSEWNSMICANPKGFHQADLYGNVDAHCLFAPHLATHPDFDPSFSFTNSGLRIMATLYDIRITPVPTIHSKYTYSIINEGDLMIFHKMDPEVELPGDNGEWKLCVLGAFMKNDGGPFVVLLRTLKNKFPPRYKREWRLTAMPPPLEELVKKPPQTIFIE
ncbi:hypothetical protein ONZ45_g14859 [Pleurotus djamor]|nr:hypothetical protein ONZ45_g14859 [Pleurotus djamor]